MRDSNFKFNLWIMAAAVLLALVFACSTKRSLQPEANRPPETHLYLQFSDSTQLPGESVSLQVIHWYGDDPDGEVVGYEWAWDSTNIWNYTTDVMDTFFVPIRVAHDTFTFYIRAIDNDSLRDPTPDHISFPITNSPPRVSFPIDFVNTYSRTAYSSFSYFSIGWRGTDPDGDQTITRYEWCLVDSSVRPGQLDTVTWHPEDSLTTWIPFTDLDSGSYRFYLRALDVAGDYGPVIFYPDTTVGAVWNVLPQHGNVLFIDDDRYAPHLQDTSIVTALTEIYGPDGFSIWDVQNRISYYPRDIEHTLRLFNKVIWHGGPNPHFKEAAFANADYPGAMISYLRNGGHLLAFSTQGRSDTTIYPFLPMDSLTYRNMARLDTYNEIYRDSLAGDRYPDTLFLPDGKPLYFSYGFRPSFPSELLPGAVQPLYRQRLYDSPPESTATAIVAARYPAAPAPAKVIYFSMHLYDCTDQFTELIRVILEQEFAQ